MSKSLYIEVANAIAQSIDSGSLAQRDALPAERALSEDYNVSRETMRKAIKLLGAQGYVVSRHGRGTFVAPDQLRDMHRSIDGWSDEAIGNGRNASQQILSVDVVTGSPLILRSLSLPTGSPLVRIHRVQSLDGKPMGIHESFVSVDQPNNLTAAKLQSVGSLYKLLRTEFALTLTHAAESIGAVSATAKEADLLGLPPNTPLLRIERITVSDDLNPVEFCVMKYAQTYSYDTVVHRQGIGN